MYSFFCSKPTVWDGDENAFVRYTTCAMVFQAHCVGWRPGTGGTRGTGSSEPTVWDGDEPSGRLLTALGSPPSKPTVWDGD
ncbi:hypothetical protein [Thermocrinis sp.]|uniref:hypothetical protein n=1 Tax=Thermocrinis sp. TaxID=2024383 RepID=UPI003C069CEE